jgi:ABC-type nitrate/sulfonate/bicarbonate transport system substrate-binding protein
MRIEIGDRKIQAGPLRIALWSLAVAAIVALFFLQADSDRFGSARNAAGEANEEYARGIPAGGDLPRIGRPALRLGALDRAAHLAVLSGIFLNSYALAVRDEGWLEPRIKDRAAQLVAALRSGDLDVAALPLRDAIRLALEPEAPIVIVAGCSRGDERIVLGPGRDGADFAGLSIGVLEPPALDVARRLGLESESPPRVRLESAAAIGTALTSRELDAAVLPEPFATATAERVGGRILELARNDADPAAGAVFVMRRAYAAEQPRIARDLVHAHLVATFVTLKDQGTAIARARAVIGEARLVAPTEILFAKGLEHVTFDAAIPREDLVKLALLALAGGEASALPQAREAVAAIVDESHLAAARVEFEKPLDEAGG